MFTVCFNVDTGRSEMDLSKKSQFILLDFLVKRATLRTLIHWNRKKTNGNLYKEKGGVKEGKYKKKKKKNQKNIIWSFNL